MTQVLNSWLVVGASRILGNSDTCGRGDSGGYSPRAPQSVLKSWTGPLVVVIGSNLTKTE